MLFVICFNLFNYTKSKLRYYFHFDGDPNLIRRFRKYCVRLNSDSKIHKIKCWNLLILVIKNNLCMMQYLSHLYIVYIYGTKLNSEIKSNYKKTSHICFFSSFFNQLPFIDKSYSGLLLWFSGIFLHTIEREKLGKWW